MKNNFKSEIMKRIKSKFSFMKGSKYSFGYILILFLMVLTPMYAQTSRNISGQVVDELGEAIIGANVTVVGNKSLGTITDIDGNFTLTVTEGAILEVSYIGYVNKKVNVDKNTNYRIVLKEDAEQLDEVVVVGYGTQKKVNLTGAVSAITNEELAATKSQNAQNMLTGKVPGVRVIQKTSEPGEFTNQFDIRGFGSPLIVVDGIPRGDLQRMDPNEIESISVLKDASAAIYGVRAANGVEMNIVPDIQKYKLNGKNILICSDGLFNSLEDEEILNIVKKNMNVKDKVHLLIEQANEHGGHDNIAAVLIEGGR